MVLSSGGRLGGTRLHTQLGATSLGIGWVSRADIRGWGGVLTCKISNSVQSASQLQYKNLFKNAFFTLPVTLSGESPSSSHIEGTVV